MEINNIGSALNVYKKMDSGYKRAAAKSSDPVGARNVDRVEFSSAASDAANISAAKAEIKRDVESGASEERIEALRSAVANGSYYVSPERVAGAIFEA